MKTCYSLLIKYSENQYQKNTIKQFFSFIKIQAQFKMNHSQKQYFYLFAIIGLLKVIVKSQIIGQMNFMIIEELNCVFYHIPQESKQQWRFKFFIPNDNYDGQKRLDLPSVINPPQYYIDNNQVYISTMEGLLENNQRQFFYFDLRVDFNQIRDGFLRNRQCAGTFYVKKYGEYYYFICAARYIIQDKDFSNLQYKTQIFQQISQMSCQSNYQNYMISQDLLIYKSYIINISSLNQYCYSLLLVDKQFDLFVYEDDNTITICQLDVNSSNLNCLKQLIINKPYIGISIFQIFISQVVESNGVNLIAFALSAQKVHTFYDISTFTVLQTSGYIKQIDNITQSIQIKNIIMVYQQQKVDQKIIFRYNIQTQKVDITQLDWKNSQYTFTNALTNQFQPYKGTLQRFSNLQNFDKNPPNSEVIAITLLIDKQDFSTIIWNKNFILATCRDYCDDCQQAIDSQKCLQCLISYFLQPDNITCEKSCPSLSIQNNDNLTCDCVQNASLINNQCQCNSQFHMEGNACIQCSIPNCGQCKDSIACMKCQQGYYLFEDFSCNICNIQDGYYKNGQNCLRCFHSCQTCEGPNQNQCLSCKLPDFYMFQDKQCKPCDINNGNFISNQNCISCSENCKTCLGANQNQCTSCYEGYDIINNFCQQTSLNYNSQVFTEQKIQQIQQISSSTSSALIVSTTIMNLIQNIGSNSSFGILISSLTVQKLAYLYLLNANLPKQISSALEILSGKLPSQQFKVLNPFSQLLDNYLIQYQNIKYQKMELPYHILVNCGQAIILFAICSFLFALFYILTEKIQIDKVKQNSIKVYQSLFSSLIIQYFQLIISIFVISINQQIKEFFLQLSIEQLGIKLFITYILLILTKFICKQQYKYLNTENNMQPEMSFQEITKNKIQNETIYDSKLRRNFIIIYQFYESFLLPTCFIQLCNNWIAANIVSIILYLNLFVMVIYLRPFFSKLTNMYFIINYLIWLLLQIQFLVLNYYCNQNNISEYTQDIDAISLSFLINILIVQLIQPFYMLVTLSIKIYDLVKQKIVEKKLQQQEDQLNQQQFTDLNQSNTQIELVNNKIKPFNIIKIFKQNKCSQNQKDELNILDKQNQSEIIQKYD
ncbi:transmembrane protein, putative (macronuclear) [Tetrahymena thermophila SB210]|uniref:Transmembrane protein, putative n=1 Tax=Tetrahymena thermophila (strain SB210) TaxID=312017 RepID=I7MGX4_TETTS|nr:transmembrane protein, putative [Tetrahymena thermophila SB210]EAR85554.2 transmembrane protein, putative [Tetrahymena thermophila SB210]|eukprot:XP_001033217.2 transmembrane protein, putative [Tetrahymena thermophila SB210]